jgi:hypothetical protein
MSFVEGPGVLKATINAQHKRFGPEETETASDVGIKFGSPRQLKKSYSNPFKLRSRHSTLDIIDDGEDLFGGIVDGIEETVTSVIDEATSAIESIATSVIDEATSAIESIATSVGGEILKEIDSLEQGASTEWSFNINMHHNIKNDTITAESGNGTSNGTVETDETRKNVMEDAQEIMPGLPSITFLDSHASMNLEFQFKFQTSIAKGIGREVGIDIDDKEGGDKKFGKRDISDWVQDASLTVVAVEPVDVRLQIETVFPAGVTLFCSLYLWPIPGAFACVPLASVGPVLEAPFNMPHTPQNPGEGDEKKNMGAKGMDKMAKTPNKYLEKLPSKGPSKPSKDSNNKKPVAKGTMEDTNVSN